MIKKRVPVNSAGKRIGQEHQLAKLTDQDIELILYLREQGLSYGDIAKKFDDGRVTVSKSHVYSIVKGIRRGQWPARWKVISVPDK
jgi:hypothetical protein